MKIGIVKERRAGEQRVAATPETVKKYVKLGLEVWVENDAGVAAGYPDELYILAGAKCSATAPTWRQ